MGMQLVLTLSDDLYKRAKQWAALTQRDVPQILTDALEIILTPVQESPAPEPAVTMMTDAEVMLLTQVQMAPRQGGRLDDLLAKQQEEPLTAYEQTELLALMQEPKSAGKEVKNAVLTNKHRLFRHLGFHLVGETPKSPKIAVGPMNIERN